ncbi:MAG: phosphate uptake regulator PhoU [Acidobacteria bacterium]|nr:phosphate uptake regulator PhoU [Acidobacteriota bacterium]MBV9622738.1 phosphate uptake regulator PhoU [Acidobacteriota bacterium]
MTNNSFSESDSLVVLTRRAYGVASAAAQTAADLILGANSGLEQIAAYERQLDELDREIDERLATEIADAPLPQVREKLACLKCMIDLERVGDLLLSFSTRADTVRSRLDMQDLRDLGDMLAILSRMLSDTDAAFSSRDHARALEVLRADWEVDRLHNLIVMRHLEPQSAFGGPHSVHVIGMAQAVERAADHVKNTAEEVCHLVSGHTVRHLLRLKEKSAEQLYLEHLHQQHLGGGTRAE